MSYKVFLFLIAAFAVTSLKAQNTDWANIQKYSNQNNGIKMEKQKPIAVFMGNSITEIWANQNPDFFKDNDYVGRGIGGQITPQMLGRFREDVLNLKPKVVVINGGINDIAENMGVPYKEELTFGYIKSMAELAKANGIKVILTSVLPAANIPWNSNIREVPEKVESLNRNIKAYAEANKFAYVDYYSSLVDQNRGMKASFTTDGVHVSPEGYKIMDKIIKKAIQKAK